MTKSRGFPVRRTNDPAVVAAIQVLKDALEQRTRRVAELLSGGIAGISRPELEHGFEKYPQAWGEPRPLQELGKEPLLVDGKSESKAEVGSTQPRSFEPHASVLHLGQEAITVDGEVNFSTAKQAQMSETQIRSCQLEPGDLLIIRVNASPDCCGRAGLVVSLPERAVYKAGIWRLRIDSNILHPRLLLHWLHHPPVRERMNIPGSTASQASINQTKFRELPCPRIKASEQREIVDELCRLDKAVADAAKALANQP